jgi:hypothetical protein
MLLSNYAKRLASSGKYADAEIESMVKAKVKANNVRWGRGHAKIVADAIAAAKPTKKTTTKRVSGAPDAVVDKKAQKAKEKLEWDAAHLVQAKMEKGRMVKETPPMCVKRMKETYPKEYAAKLKELKAAAAAPATKPKTQKLKNPVSDDPNDSIVTVGPNTANGKAAGKKGSVAISLHPLTQAMLKAEALARRKFGAAAKFIPNAQPFTKTFAGVYPKLQKDLPLIPEMKSMVSGDSGAIGKFTGQGKAASAAPTGSNIYIGAFFEAMMQWKIKGGKDVIKNTKGTWLGVKMKETNAKLCAGGVLRVGTKKNDVICMMMHPGFKSPEEAFVFASKVKKDAGHPVIGIFPKVALKAKGNFKWILNSHVGASASSADAYRIFGCETMNILRMDELGVYVKSAVRMSMNTKSAAPRPPKEYKIDKPFLFWIERKGCALPIFVAWLDVDSWVKGSAAATAPAAKSKR